MATNENNVIDLKDENHNDRVRKQSSSSENVELVPPDGGWGWAIVVATALGCVIVLPAIQIFALLYRDRFVELGLSATDISVIININSAFGMLLGLFHGSVLNRFGFRKVSAVGSFLVFVGLVLTSFANSFVYFIITYGLITSVGVTVIYPSFQLALSTYFMEKRGKAMGFATTIMGIGYIIMPPLVSYMLSMYGEVGAGLLVAALTLNSLVGSALLQPIKWHMKKKEVIQETVCNPYDITDDSQSLRRRYGSRRLSTSTIDHDMDAQSLYGFEIPIVDTNTSQVTGKRRNLSNTSFRRNKNTTNSENSSHVGTPVSENNLFWWSATSLNAANIGGSNIKISDIPLHEADEEEHEQDETDISKCGDAPLLVDHSSTEHIEMAVETKNERRNGILVTKSKPPKRKGFIHQILSRIVKELDLTLLKDPYYLNLMIGMSIAITAEINFSYMTPLFLGALGFSYDETAVLMAIIASADLIFRFLTPFFADYMKYDARRMYVISLFLLIISRTTMIFFSSFNAMIGVSLAIGIGRGVRTVYMFLVIPSYVPIERLPSASGLQMVANGIILLSFGPILGFVKDVTGTYNSCIVAINLATTTTLVMWLTESTVTWYRNRTLNR